VTDREPVPFRITICGLDELAARGCGDATHVLSILDPGWPDPPELKAQLLHRRVKLRFHDVIDPLPGVILPERWDVELLLAFGREATDYREYAAGSHLLIHCHAGVSRSTAAAILILAQRHADRPADEAILGVVRLRPRAWPNLRMLELGDAALGRNGEIVKAAAAYYRAALDREPGLAATMIENGRGREVTMAGRA
jgi:predicted protein tyrosine phosphatase